MVWFTQNSNFDPIAYDRARTDRANYNASLRDYQNAICEWETYSNKLKNQNTQLRNALNNTEAELNAIHAAAVNMGDVQKLSSKGITLPAYTNNLAHEMYILRDELLGVNPLGPFGHDMERNKRLADLTVEERREINTRLLCRVEWFDWCNHADVIAKFNTILLGAQMNPTEANKHLRQRSMLTFYQQACEQYFRERDLAMNPNMGEQVRAGFEQQRFLFWKPQLRFALNNANELTNPSFVETVKVLPSLRPDTYLVGGKVVEKFGLHIGTLKPAKYFRDCLASYEVPAGIRDRVGGNYFVQPIVIY